MNDINETARSYFATKIANGGVPGRVAGGRLDGLEYFSIELEGAEYWLTARGLFDPAESADGVTRSDTNEGPIV